MIVHALCTMVLACTNWIKVDSKWASIERNKHLFTQGSCITWLAPGWPCCWSDRWEQSLDFFFGSPLTHSNPFHSGLTSSAFILAGLLLLASSLLHLLSWILLYRRRIPSPNPDPQSQFSVPILQSGPWAQAELNSSHGSSSTAEGSRVPILILNSQSQFSNLALELNSCSLPPCSIIFHLEYENSQLKEDYCNIVKIKPRVRENNDA